MCGREFVGVVVVVAGRGRLQRTIFPSPVRSSYIIHLAAQGLPFGVVHRECTDNLRRSVECRYRVG